MARAIGQHHRPWEIVEIRRKHARRPACPYPRLLTFVTIPRRPLPGQCPQLSRLLPQPKRQGNLAMKPKDWKFPTIGEHYQLQLQPVVSESYPQGSRNRSRADRRFVLGAAIVDPMSDRTYESASTRH